MTMFLRHMFVRARMLCTDTVSVVMLLFAAASSYILWPWTVQRPTVDIPGVDIFIILLGLILWPFMVGAIMHGRNFGERGSLGPQIATEFPVPALPIKLYWRILADSLTALAIVLILRLPGLFLGLFLSEDGRSLFGVPESDLGNGSFMGWFARQSAICALIFLPPLIAWCTPSRNHVLYIIKPLVISVPLFAAVMLGVAEHPFICAATCLPLAAVTLLSAGWEPSFARKDNYASRSFKRIHRPGLEPRVRLRRDQWLEPVRIAWPYLAVILPVEIVVLLLGDLAERPVPWRGLIEGASVGLILGFVVLRPVGLQLLKPVHSPNASVTGRATLMDGWSHLPVPRESVVRGVYMHVLLGGVFLVILSISHGILEQILGSDSGRPSLAFNPLIFSIPVMAGLAVSIAVGDRVRSAVSFVTLIAFLPVHIFVFMWLRESGMSASEFGPGMAIDFGVLAVLTFIGGIPPLVHLRRSKPRYLTDLTAIGACDG